MQKRIFLNFVGLIIACVVLMAMSFGALFFRAAQNHEIASIQDKAYLVAQLINAGEHDYSRRLQGGNTRITLIDADGWALSDSYGGADMTINRSDRPEFIRAVAFGSSEAVRRSATFAAETYYYAILLQSGNVLRLSKTLSGLGGVFTSTIPMLVLITIAILTLAHFIVHRMTRLIVKPLAEVDFESTDALSSSALGESLYEELWPYIRKIDNQKKEIEKQMATLKNRAETIEAIIANMREGLVILDENGMVMAVNKSAMDIFYLPDEESVVQKNIKYVYRDPEFLAGIKECLKGKHLETALSRNDRIYNVFLNPVIGGGTCRGAVIFFLDSTEQFNAEKQRKEFSANVSHELKTPLTTISALSEMMANGMAKPDDVIGFADKITVHAKRLIHIIESIIRLSEFDENKVQNDFVIFDIHELAESVIEALQDKAREKSVTLKVTGDTLKINANSRLIDELLYNLVDNGIKYNIEGGNVIVDLRREKEFCKITVTDMGIGIPKEHHDRIFERFYRVDSSRSKKTGGTGLGLAIVKNIAEHHGGRVALKSTEDDGTTVMCYIKM